VHLRCDLSRLRSIPASGDHAQSFGQRQPCLRLVPPLPFLVASAVCSGWSPAGLLHPAADHGVRQVSGPSLSLFQRAVHRSFVAMTPCAGFSITARSRRIALRHQFTTRAWLPFRAPPRAEDDVENSEGRCPFPLASTPYEAFPSPGAVPRHRGPSLLVVSGQRASFRNHSLPTGCARWACPRWANAFALPFDLKVLLPCRVRCPHPALPPGRCPMLPWA